MQNSVKKLEVARRHWVTIKACWTVVPRLRCSNISDVIKSKATELCNFQYNPQAHIEYRHTAHCICSDRTSLSSLHLSKIAVMVYDHSSHTRRKILRYSPFIWFNFCHVQDNAAVQLPQI